MDLPVDVTTTTITTRMVRKKRDGGKRGKKFKGSVCVFDSYSFHDVYIFTSPCLSLSSCVNVFSVGVVVVVVLPNKPFS